MSLPVNKKSPCLKNSFFVKLVCVSLSETKEIFNNIKFSRLYINISVFPNMYVVQITVCMYMWIYVCVYCRIAPTYVAPIYPEWQMNMCLYTCMYILSIGIILLFRCLCASECTQASEVSLVMDFEFCPVAYLLNSCSLLQGFFSSFARIPLKSLFLSFFTFLFSYS